MQLGRALRIAALLLAVSLLKTAVAQVPPHVPGTVCFTPQFWCWMAQPGYPGTPCFCPSPYGYVQGVTG